MVCFFKKRLILLLILLLNSGLFAEENVLVVWLNMGWEHKYLEVYLR